jgi:uncharacterized membrane protein
MTVDPGSALVVILLGATPFFEARYAIPAAIVYGFPPSAAFALGIIGNILPVIALLLFLEPVSRWLSAHSPTMAGFFSWLFSRTRRYDTMVNRWGAYALFLFVAVPLPFTGTWSGCALAFVFGIPFSRAFPAIVVGAVAAALMTTLPTIGILDLLGGGA